MNDSEQKQAQAAPVKLPGDAYASHIRARLWLTGAYHLDQGGYVGVGRITLLEKIDQTGSMNQAAKAMGMSYKKAWKLVAQMNQMFAQPLVEKSHGGKQGGGTYVTAQGYRVIESFRELEQKIEAFLVEQNQAYLQKVHLFNRLDD